MSTAARPSDMEAVERVAPPADTELVVEPVDPAKARRVAWIGLLVLAGLQAWNARFMATPDGVSYVDLSDAIVTGHLGDIVNAYWSPLYPALIGVARLIVRPGGYWEFALVHALNFLLFAVSIAAFEYFLAAVSVAAARLGRHDLDTAIGRLIAYVIFGVLSLMMTPLSLPTPDLIVTSATFIAFGAMLRLRDDPSRAGNAVMLGLALAVGALAKSFFVPWSLVVLGLAWIATRRAGWRPTAIAVGVWLIVVAPWCAALSAHQGHFTFGDTGRLTYIWNVNQVESPSLKIMPHGSTSPGSESVLTGVAVTPNARGTNPVWFDPARWYTDLKPVWEPSKQLMVFSSLATQFFSSLGPIMLVIWFAFAAATRVQRAAWLGDLWIILLPALVAMGAYSMVLVTTRYIAPFIVTLAILTAFCLRWPSRLTPGKVAVGLGVPIMIMVVTPGDNLILSFTNATLAAVLFAWSFHRQRRAMQIVAAVLGGLSIWILLPRQLHTFVVLGALLIVVLFWTASRQALRRGEAAVFSRAMRRGLLAANGLVIATVFVLKYNASIAPPQTVRGEANTNWLQSDAMRQAGFGPGTRVAIIGSPFEAYWARTGGLQIVGVVPPWRVASFMELPEEKRQVLYREFARVGARAVVSQSPDAPVAGDSTWIPYEYIGWVKRLPGR
jgi:hypothetical protein